MIELKLRLDGRVHDVKMEPTEDGWEGTVDGTAISVSVARNKDGGLEIAPTPGDGPATQTGAVGDEFVVVDGTPSAFEILELHGVAGLPEGGQGPLTVRPPMPGRLVRLDVTPGDAVASGDVLFVLEAMKMQNEVRAAGTGTVKSVAAAVGDTVDPGQVIIELEAP